MPLPTEQPELSVCEWLSPARMHSPKMWFCPPPTSAVLRTYAQQAGTDWMEAMDKSPDCDNVCGQFRDVSEELIEKEQLVRTMSEQLIEKEQLVRTMSEQLIEKEQLVRTMSEQLIEKERVIQQQKQSAFERLRAVIKMHGRPKLGRLSIHDPVPLQSWGLPPRRAYNGATALPRISIVTPSYGQADFIARTIESVLTQNYPNLEYFIQDGGSTDGTVEILKQYADRLSGWESAEDNGQSQAINQGFSKTSGEVMAWLNSDDLLLSGTLAYVANYFSRHPEVDMVYGHRILIDEQDKEIGRWILPRHSNTVLPWMDYIPQETVFWRRSLWQKIGGHVDESFRFAMDWDLWLRFHRAGARMVRLPFFLGAFRIHTAQKTLTAMNEVGLQEIDKLRERELGRPVSRKEIKKAVMPYLMSHITYDLLLRIRKRLKKYDSN